MKVLFIGGTGTISTAISRRILESEKNIELYLYNRGKRNDALPPGAKWIEGDINDEADAAKKLAGLQFDVVANFIVFSPAQVERDYRLFNGKTGQYIVISSASAYQKPLSDYRITEGTPLANPYWEYSRNKIAIEEFLMKKYREEGFPATIVRPSHTYDERSVPLGVHGKKGSWQVIKRMMEGKPVIIHGDGTSLWTMTDSRDFAGAFIGLLGNVHAAGEAVQITSDESVTWNQIYTAIAAALAEEGKLPAATGALRAVHVSSEFLAAAGPDYDFTGGLIGDKASSVVFDNTKLKRLVPGWTAQIRFDQGVRHTLKHVLAHPELQVADPEFDAWCDSLIKALDEAALKVCPVKTCNV
jgi:nucleoside-diphosphate-sugar epimerase